VGRVERLFPDRTVVCIASGPSLAREDVEFCQGRAPVVAVNDAYRLAPWADVLYACDSKWWNHHHGVPGCAGLKFALQHQADRWPGVTVLARGPSVGLDLDPSSLATGMNSGYQAINLAVHLGARRIVLLGYDMQRLPGQPSHFFGEHPRDLRRDSPYPRFAEVFLTLVEPLRALGVSVVNCSRETALTSFPRMPLSEALALTVAA
jgi:hypothetical protein